MCNKHDRLYTSIYIQVRNTMILHSLDNLNKNTDSQTAMAQSVEHIIAVPKVLVSILGPSLLFDQNLGSCASCERSGKKTQKPVI